MSRSVFAMSTVISHVERMARTHGFWMMWNMVLACVPAGLAIVLLRKGMRRTKVWWFGVAVGVLFLPNAPYVLTDVIHLFDDIRGNRSDLQVLGLYVPVYLSFFALGFGLYLTALDLAHRYVRREFPTVRWWPIELALHVLCAIGIYLGRVVRLNSWDVFTRPQLLLAGTDRPPEAFAIVLVAMTAVVLVAGTMVTRVVVRGTIDLVRSWARPGPWPDRGRA